MEKYYEFKLNYNKISFCLTNNPSIDEREIHPYHEILFYLDGNAELLTKDGRQRIKNQTLIIIPEGTYHFLRSDRPSNFTRLKISFPLSMIESTPLHDVVSKIKIIDDYGDDIAYIFDKLQSTLREGSDNNGFYAYCVFMMLLSELDKTRITDAENHYVKASKFIISLEKYISKNLSENLSVQDLAEHFHVSQSGITHLFKKELGISLHKYITQKRLLCARAMIIEGSQPSKIYGELGYKDYSSFYKAYLSFYGYPPSKEKIK